jgi:hypothetical protein
MNIFNIRNQLKFTRWVDDEHISITKIKFNTLLKEKGSAEAMLVDEEFLERERSSTENMCLISKVIGKTPMQPV